MEEYSVLDRIGFEKLHACGNDFLLLRQMPEPTMVLRMCDRHHGLGADGIMVFEGGSPIPRLAHCDADGSRSFCINGLRASLACLFQQDLVPSEGQVISEGVTLHYSIRANITLELGLSPAKPLVWKQGAQIVQGFFLDVGNPQFVTWDPLPDDTIRHIAPAIRHDTQRFPQGTNATFLRKQDGAYFIRTFERGVEGFTKACGTGMLAAASVLLENGDGQRVRFQPEGLGWVEIERKGDRLYLSGPTEWVASGVWRCGLHLSS